MCVYELFSRALEQKPNANGIRQTRFVIIRNTFPQLTSTSLKTVMDWFPPGVMNYSLASPICGVLDLPLTDGTRVQSEWLFVALDIEADIARLKSLEVTLAWINEASEIPKPVLDMASMRCGRYPAMADGGPTFSGVIFDSNPPDDTHWIYEQGETKKPEEFGLWKQPPALIKVTDKDGNVSYLPNDGTHPQCGEPAENIQNLKGGFDYYMRAVQAGKDDEWVKVFILGQYGSLQSGRPVYPEYKDNIHCAKEELKPYRGLPLVLGWDFGLNASCVICQLSPKGEMLVLDEIVSEEMGIQRCIRDLVIPKLKNEYGELKVAGVGDPAGSQRSQTTEQTCFQILQENGLEVESAYTNEFAARREAVSYYLTRMVEGRPAFIISPRCTLLRKGFLGRYSYRKMRVSGTERFSDKPNKDLYSHPHDALQYVALFFRGNSDISGAANFGASKRREIKTVSLNSWA
jgi:hypothetical protein